MTSALTQFLKENIKGDFQVKPLAGDASARKYYRVTDIQHSYVVCDDQNRDNLQRFISSQNYFEKNGISVPKIFEQDLEKGFLLLEDIGDISLCVEAFAQQTTVFSLYKKSIDMIGELSKAPTESSHYLFQWKFDKKKYLEELDMADTFFYGRFLKGENVGSHLLFDELIEILEKLPYCLVHRDFHSRNLHVVDDNLYMIDFQDARVGPYLYDLVSLLEDPYFIISDSDKEKLKKYFFDHYSIQDDFSQFIEEYAVVAVQRLYKILGSFTYLFYEKNKEHYLPHVGITVARLNYYLSQTSLKAAPEFRQKVILRFYES